MTWQRSIDSAEALYRKLERTFDRRLTYGEYQVDWVFDFAVTAWHLVDWIAKETQADKQVMQEQIKKKCPELAVCEQVCNGAKHFVLNNSRLRPFSIAENVRGTDDLIGLARDIIPGGEPVDIVATGSVSISDKDGNSWEASDLFHRVFIFWRRELGLSTQGR